MPDDLFFDIVKMVVALAFILGLAYAVVYMMKRLLPGAARAGIERVELSLITQLSLGSRQKVCVVRVHDRTLVLGVTEGSINTLAEFPAVAPDARKDADDPKIFSDLLAWDKETVSDDGPQPSPAPKAHGLLRPSMFRSKEPGPSAGAGRAAPVEDDDDGPLLFPPGKSAHR